MNRIKAQHPFACLDECAYNSPSMANCGPDGLIGKYIMKILVRNLARTSTEDAVRALFAEYGHVESCVIVKDAETQQSKGFGFVEMPNPVNAITAVKRLNTRRFEGSVLRVKRVEETTEK
jgi:RNA recognition motif-containing protein